MLLPLVSLARGIDLLSLVVLLAVAAYFGTRRQASWTTRWAARSTSPSRGSWSWRWSS